MLIKSCILPSHGLLGAERPRLQPSSIRGGNAMPWHWHGRCLCLVATGGDTQGHGTLYLAQLGLDDLLAKEGHVELREQRVPHHQHRLSLSCTSIIVQLLNK
jgi:hypothetical protein